jgi:branched-chain amino acid transport system ATP-binding protein
MIAPLLALEGLAVRHGPTAALTNVDLVVAPRQAVALLGANGAGKSTLMQAVIGLLRLSAGRILFDGQRIDALRPDQRARMGIGYCPEGRRVFPGLTVRENLQVASREGLRARNARIDEMIAMFPALREHFAAPAWRLSGGQQQMLAIGRSLMDRPRLLLLDEPSAGLSPKLVGEVIGRIPGIVASGTSVLLAEQSAARALAACDEAILLAGGRVVARGKSADIAAGHHLQAAFLGG